MMRVILVNGRIIDCRKVEIVGNGLVIDDNDEYPIPSVRRIVIDNFLD